MENNTAPTTQVTTTSTAGKTTMSKGASALDLTLEWYDPEQGPSTARAKELLRLSVSVAAPGRFGIIQMLHQDGFISADTLAAQRPFFTGLPQQSRTNSKKVQDWCQPWSLEPSQEQLWSDTLEAIGKDRDSYMNGDPEKLQGSLWTEPFSIEFHMGEDDLLHESVDPQWARLTETEREAVSAQIALKSLLILQKHREEKAGTSARDVPE